MSKRNREGVMETAPREIASPFSCQLEFSGFGWHDPAR
jgi:hypothetical protein